MLHHLAGATMQIANIVNYNRHSLIAIHLRMAIKRHMRGSKTDVYF